MPAADQHEWQHAARVRLPEVARTGARFKMRDDRAVGGKLEGGEVRPVNPPAGGGATAEGCKASFGVEPFLTPHARVAIGAIGWRRGDEGRRDFVGGGGNALYAINTADGSDLWKIEMGRRVNSTPMTYRAPSGRQIVVVGSGVGRDARVTAFAVE